MLLCCDWLLKGGGRSLREMRSKFFFSSGFLFTWQVSRLSLAGGLLAWETGSEDVSDESLEQNQGEEHHCPFC